MLRPPDFNGLLESPVFEALSLAVGLIVGSFANVVIHRLPLEQSVVHPRSRCPRCGAQIQARDNLPVVSWILLRGRCRACRAAISFRYPVVEATNGFLYLMIAMTAGPTLLAAATMVFVTALLILSLIDLDHQRLPDVITKPGIVVGLAASFLPGPPSPRESAATAIGGYLALAAIAWLARLYYKEEALGQGDWKLVAMLGAFLGWQSMLLAVLLGSALGAAFGVGAMLWYGASGRSRLPLGSFLCVGGIAVVLAGAPILGWYRELLRV